MSTARGKIILGPSREELFDALRLRSEKRAVHFSVRVEGTLSATIREYLVNALEVESPSGHHWLVKLLPVGQNGTILNGFYDSNSRRGWLEIG